MGAFKVRLLVAAAVALMALFSYFTSQEFNEVTGENQRVGISPQQEISLGLQAAPSMVKKFGGASGDAEARALVERVGQRLLQGESLMKTRWKYQFTLLADNKTINAFALPGGQVFITEALFRRLKNEDQLAGVLGHEIGHVVARHGAEHIAQQQLNQRLAGAATVAAGDHSAGQMAAMVGGLVNMKYGRGDELESDRLGVRFMREAGYDPEAMIAVMKILGEASKGRQVEFFSTHPNPENRIARLREAIDGDASVKRQ